MQRSEPKLPTSLIHTNSNKLKNKNKNKNRDFSTFKNQFLQELIRHDQKKEPRIRMLTNHFAKCGSLEDQLSPQIHSRSP